MENQSSKKFGNSLKLRMVSVLQILEMTATSQAAITTAIGGGVFTLMACSNFIYTLVPPKCSIIQYGLILVQSGRSVDFVC
jgi:hypothetical protein